MKELAQFINEAANTTTIVNKIKKEFKKEFGDKVTIGSGRANYQQLYDVYIYDMDINTLKKVNDILKKHITIWKGFTDDEMQKKLDDKKEFFDKHKDDKFVTLDRYPVEFFRFTSRDLKMMIGESMDSLKDYIENSGIMLESFVDGQQMLNEAKDIHKLELDPKHVKRMKEYLNKNSNPEVLAGDIKDPIKLVGRWLAAIVLDWAEAVEAFGREIKTRKLLSDEEIIEYMDKMENEEVDTSDVKRLTDSEKRIANSWITKSVFKFFNSLDGVKTEWIETFKNSKTIAGREAMSRNGRAWTEGFKVKFTKNGKEKEFVFDIITNEGGGLYGYAVDAQKMNLSDFKTYVNAIINKL